MGGRISRRAFLRGTGAVGAALLVPLPGGAALALTDGDRPLYLSTDEMETLRALVDRIVPGPPDDPDPGAVEAGCAEAIDALLGAFLVDPPRIYAGAPYSDRGGAPTNHFARFLPLDRYEETAWRLRIEGSQGRPELEFNGPIVGWQAVYSEGLAALDEAAGDARFADLPGPMRDAILRGSDDPAIERLVDVAVPHTLELMYGAPEYGGNHGLVGWEYTGWMGDVQPRGWTREEVENPDEPGLPELLPSLPPELDGATVATLAALVSPEAMRGHVTRSGTVFSGLRTEIGGLVDRARDAQARLRPADPGPVDRP